MYFICMALFGFWAGLAHASDVMADTWSVWAGSDGNDMEIYYSVEKTGQWSSPEKIHSDNVLRDSSPAIAVDEKGNPLVVWIREEGRDRNLYASKWNGASWTLEEKVGGYSKDIRFSEPAVAIGENQEIWVVASGVKEAHDEVYYTRRSSTGWSEWEILNMEDAVPDLDPSILSYQGKIWVIWSGFDQENYTLFRRVWDGKEWSSEEKLFAGDGLGEFPSLKVEGGKPAVVFYQGAEAFLSQFDGQVWSSPVSYSVPKGFSILDVWKNQGVRKTQTGWYHGAEDRGSLNIFLAGGNSDQARTSSWVAALKKFFTVSGREAWAATTPNVYSAFGDSITQGLGTGGYPPHLEALLTGQFGPSTVINRGVGGERTTTGVSRINSVLNQDNAEFILIMEGINDAGDERSQDSIAFNLGVMIDRANAFGTRPIISTITPRRDDHNGQVESTNELIRGMAGAKGVPLVDNYAALTVTPTNEFFDTIFTDAVHYNDAGNSIIAQTWFAVIRSIKGGGSGDGGGGGGCGTIHHVKPGSWPVNMDPILLLLFLFLIFRGYRRFYRPIEK